MTKRARGWPAMVGLVLIAMRGGAWAQEAPARYKGHGAAYWAAQLGEESVDARRQAVYALYQVGANARPHVCDIAVCLRDPDAYVRTTAERVLSRWSFPNTVNGLTPALSQLVAALNDERGDVRIMAGNLIYKAGPIPNVVGETAPPDFLVPALATALADSEPKVRANAAACLLNVWQHAKPALPALAKAIEDVDATVRLWALRAAPAIDAAWAAAHALKHVKDENPDVRVAAATALGQVAPPASDAIYAGLDTLLEDPVDTVRTAAVNALWSVGEPRAAALLTRIFESDGSPAVRGHAALGLGALGYPAAAPRLRAALDAANPLVRSGAIAGLARLGPEGAEAIDRIVPMIASENADVRRSALTAVGLLAPWAESAVPGLVAAVEGEDPRWRGLAASSLYGLALAGHRDPRMLAASIRALGCGEPSTAQYALQVVGEFGAAAKDAVPALGLLLAPDSGWRNRRGLHLTIAALGAAAAPLAGRLAVAMQDEAGDPLGAAMALACVSPDTEARERAIGRLVEATRDKRSADAIYLLYRVGAGASPAREVFRQVLDGDGPNGKWHAAAALLRIGGEDAAKAAAWLEANLPEAGSVTPFRLIEEAGDAARPLVPVLLKVATDPAHRRRAAALRALRKIGAVGDAVRKAYVLAGADPAPRTRTEGALGLRALAEEQR